MLDIIIKL